ncbi:MAG: hypothetical protein K8S16_00395 [Bacteroidales bacterium]|nr:hypothetical protein [Bacteroidales bacterium]
MNKLIEFNKIKDAYFNKNFDKVINLYEKQGERSIVDLSQDEDRLIFEEVASSYYHIKDYDKSINAYRAMLRQLLKNDFKSKEYHRLLDHYIMAITTILAHQKKIIKEYYYVRLYKRKGGNTTEILITEKGIEEILFLRYKKFKNVFYYIYISFILLAFFSQIFLHDYLFINRFYTNAFVIAGLLFITTNLILRKKMKRILIKILNWFI